MATIGTYNEEGVNVDLYIPRKCHATNTLIASNDYSSVQIAIANVDAEGVTDGTTTTFCISGFIRSQGIADHAINHLAIDRGIIRIKSAKPKTHKKKKVAAGKKGVKGAAPAAAGKKGAKGAKPVAAPAVKPKQGAKAAKPTAQKGAKPQGKKAQAPRRN
ncbi:histone H1.5-like [Bactrocera neohumeralis]|uniref:histone H1.5-like n=1 Tax=Bactrocera neohumeralis TaxID=98809 RepID=UPI002165E25F|nr:histone H1.5-like [Bactrocera neohumeralis]